MNKQEFLAELRKGLSGLPQDDIEERLTFYNETLEDTITTSPRSVFLSRNGRSSRRSKMRSSVKQSACGWMRSPSRRKVSASTTSRKNSTASLTTTECSEM